MDFSLAHAEAEVGIEQAIMHGIITWYVPGRQIFVVSPLAALGASLGSGT